MTDDERLEYLAAADLLEANGFNRFAREMRERAGMSARESIISRLDLEQAMNLSPDSITLNGRRYVPERETGPA